MNRLTFDGLRSKTFEISLVVRDYEGNPTGSRSYQSDNPYKIWEFYQRHRGKPKRNKRKKSQKIPSNEQAQKLLVEAAEYAEQRQKERDGE